MANERRLISVCGECSNYNWKKHKCMVCSCKESNPRSSFYDDCPLPKGVEVVRCKDCKHAKELGEAEKEIYLDECLICTSGDATIDGYNIVMPEHFCSYGKKAAKDGDTQ